MGTKIHWADETINPIVGCSKTSNGCTNCYAEKMARRLASMGIDQYIQVSKNGIWNNSTAFVPTELEKPRKWKKARTIFISSMGDLFHETVSFELIDQIMRIINNNKHHTFIILTKRAKRMNEYFNGLAEAGTNTATAERLLKNVDYSQNDHGWHMQYLTGKFLPNLVLGITAEDQHMANERIPLLLKTPSKKRFVSIEPMLAPIDLKSFLWTDMNNKIQAQQHKYEKSINGVIVGGESGTKARPINPDWIRTIRDQCKIASIPFMFKQWGTWYPDKNNKYMIKMSTKKTGNMLDGQQHLELCW